VSDIDLYRQMHAAGHFPGHSTKKHSAVIKELIDKHGAKTLLDYGCGKGHQYYVQRLHDEWGVEMPVLYDPAVPGIDKLVPGHSFDGVICTDVVEHLEGTALYDLIDDCIFRAKKFVLFGICTRPAKKSLPDGRNVHLTVESVDWWRGYVRAIAISHSHKPEIRLEFE
jgi:hypothetical protein